MTQDPSRPKSSVNSHDRHRDALLGLEPEQTPFLSRLSDGIRDFLFPRSLPPLELTSKPIAVTDPMAIRTNPWAVGAAAMVNSAILALILSLGFKAVTNPQLKSASHPRIDLSNLLAPFTLRAAQGGGDAGGGAQNPVDPIVGRLPKFERTPLAPLQTPVLEHPKLAVDPAVPIDVTLLENSSMPNIGLHSSPNVTLVSGGPGGRNGIGMDGDGGLGSDKSFGVGSGPGGVYSPGGDVSDPIPIVTPEAEVSDEARRAKYQGVCMISVIIDALGNPQSPHVIRSLGMGLDEKALEAVRKYRFKPATRKGRPVPVRIAVAVDFRLY